jgi:hypothetical protein
VFLQSTFKITKLGVVGLFGLFEINDNLVLLFELSFVLLL